jgi:hypothetical protein
MRVPRLMGAVSVSSDTAKVPPAADSHLCCTSSLCLEYTTTLSATRYAL